MTRYEITIATVVYNVVDEFNSEEEARKEAINLRDKFALKTGLLLKPVFYELTEVSDV